MSEISSPAETGFDPDRLARVAKWQRSYVDGRKYPGSSVLLLRHGKEVLFNACGLRDRENGSPFTRDTVVRIYSMTKPITSVALMALLERGIISMSTPLAEILPEFGDCHTLLAGATKLGQVQSCPSPTIHQLLTHTSGLTYAFNAGPIPAEMRRLKLDFDAGTKDLAGQIRALARLPLAFLPGTRWEYSVGIDVIGRVIEVLAGMTLGNFLRETIFEPLAMDRTGFRVSSNEKDRFAALYTPLEGNPMNLGNADRGADTLRLVESSGESRYFTTAMESGGGGLVSTIDDYMKFVEMLRQGGAAPHGRILSHSTVQFMLRNHLGREISELGPQSFAEQPMHGMGFGVGGAIVLDPARVGVPGHAGDFSWGGMASTFFWMDRQSAISVVFLTQLAPSSAYPARAELKAIIHGALLA